MGLVLKLQMSFLFFGKSSSFLDYDDNLRMVKNLHLRIPTKSIIFRALRDGDCEVKGGDR